MVVSNHYQYTASDDLIPGNEGAGDQFFAMAYWHATIGVLMIGGIFKLCGTQATILFPRNCGILIALLFSLSCGKAFARTPFERPYCQWLQEITNSSLLQMQEYQGAGTLRFILYAQEHRFAHPVCPVYQGNQPTPGFTGYEPCIIVTVNEWPDEIRGQNFYSCFIWSFSVTVTMIHGSYPVNRVLLISL